MSRLSFFQRAHLFIRKRVVWKRKRRAKTLRPYRHHTRGTHIAHLYIAHSARACIF